MKLFFGTVLLSITIANLECMDAYKKLLEQRYKAPKQEEQKSERLINPDIERSHRPMRG